MIFRLGFEIVSLFILFRDRKKNSAKFSEIFEKCRYVLVYLLCARPILVDFFVGVFRLRGVTFTKVKTFLVLDIFRVFFANIYENQYNCDLTPKKCPPTDDRNRQVLYLTMGRALRFLSRGSRNRSKIKTSADCGV